MSNTPVGAQGWLGNPYPASDPRAIEQFTRDFEERLGTDAPFREAVSSLRGKRLACWCAPTGGVTAADRPYICHAQVIAAWLDEGPVAH
jgi:hypothetical protein